MAREDCGYEIPVQAGNMKSQAKDWVSDKKTIVKEIAELRKKVRNETKKLPHVPGLGYDGIFKKDAATGKLID